MSADATVAETHLQAESGRIRIPFVISRILAAKTLLSSHKPQILPEQTDSIIPPLFESQQEVIIDLLKQYQWNLENRLKDLESLCQQNSTFCFLGHQLLNSLSVNMRQIRRTTSLPEIRQILDKLKNIALEACLSIQNLASPPLLEKFAKLRANTFLELSIKNFAKKRLLEHKEEIIRRIQRLSTGIEESQSASAGSLSKESVKKLQWGYQQHKRYLFKAETHIRRAPTNRKITQALRTLQRSVGRNGRTLKSLLCSPQLALQEQAFTFLGKLYAARRDLGETVSSS